MTVAVSVVLALAFLAAGAAKLAGASASNEMRDHLGITAIRWRAIGLLEVAGAAGVLIGLGASWLGAAAATGLVLTSIGAVATHLGLAILPKRAYPRRSWGRWPSRPSSSRSPDRRSSA